MSNKMNCWEFMKCGMEKGGVKAGELGICSAFSETRVHGVNGGINGGRACWAISGTLCYGTVQGTFATKLGNCLNCEFYKVVVAEEGPNLLGAREIVARLKS